MEAPCPRCGDDTDGYGPRNLCSECFLDEENLLDIPGEIAVERCSHCGRLRNGMDWVDVEGDREVIAEALEMEIETGTVEAVSFDDTGEGYSLTLLVEDEVSGETFQQELGLELNVENVQCGPCAKFEGGYFEYKIQLRGENLEEVLEKVMDRALEVTEKDREDFVSNVEERDGGYDLYVSSRDMAEELLKVVRERYDMEEKRSKELVGQEEGEKVYRSVVSARVKSDG